MATRLALSTFDARGTRSNLLMTMQSPLSSPPLSWHQPTPEPGVT